MKIKDIEQYLQFPNFVIKGNKRMLERAEKELVRLGCTNDPHWNNMNKKKPEAFIKVWCAHIYEKPYFYYLTETCCIEESTPVIELTETKLEAIYHYLVDNWLIWVVTAFFSSLMTLLMVALYFML